MLRVTVGVTDVGGHAPNALAAAAVHTALSIGADSPAQQLVRNPVRSRHLLQQVTVAGPLVAPASGEQDCVHARRYRRCLNCQQPNGRFAQDERHDDAGESYHRCSRQLTLSSSAGGAVAASQIDSQANDAAEPSQEEQTYISWLQQLEEPQGMFLEGVALQEMKIEHGEGHAGLLSGVRKTVPMPPSMTAATLRARTDNDRTASVRRLGCHYPSSISTVFSVDASSHLTPQT